MKKYDVSLQIAASAESVWSVLVNDLPQDPTAFGIIRFEGMLSENGRIRLWSEVDPKRVFALKVQTLDPPRKMVWKGGMPLGLFTGTRTFTLSQTGYTTRFKMQEDFSGALSGLIVKTIPDLNPSFEKFAQTLKRKAENHE